MKYVPVLRQKRSEQSALVNLFAQDAINILPLIELLDRGGNVSHTFFEKISNTNFYGNKIIVDPVHALTNYHFVDLQINTLLSQGVGPILAIDPFDTNQIQLANILISKGSISELALRFRVGQSGNQNYLSTIAGLPNNVKSSLYLLILDYELVNHLHTAFATDMLGKANEIKELNITTVILMGSFPPSLANIPTGNNPVSLHRHESDIWDIVRAKNSEIVYGDYCNIHPLIDLTVGSFPGSASIKYTSDKSYYIFRGLKPGGHPDGNEQYRTHCQSLVTLGFYDGSSFSYGDTQISTVANNPRQGPGNAETWVKNTVNHHLTKLARIL